MNPNRFDDESKLNYLCAAGVCLMFLIALNKKLRESKWFDNNNIKEPNLINYLDLVSLGTVCDVVPLIGLNRAIVSQGLEIFKKKSIVSKDKVPQSTVKINLAPLDNSFSNPLILGPYPSVFLSGM